MTKRSNIAKLLAMFLLGGAIAAIVTLLLAPRSGKETREQLKDRRSKFIDKLKQLRRRTKDQINLTKISNWGNYPNIAVELHEFENVETLQNLLKDSNNVIARGNGRCYGDSALAPHIISTLRYNKFLSFDKEQGIICCQSGVLLSEILDVIVPEGWFLPVTPGTKLITVGGAIASNVHGKSQHKAGNFADYLVDLRLMLDDGSIVTCSETENADLFWATCGGMGLTGIVLDATLRLMSIETAYVRQESIKAKNLDHLMDLFEQSEGWTYSLAWIDCLAKGDHLGRGYIMRGEHATVAELEKAKQRQNPLNIKLPPKLNVPFNFPNFALNPLTARLFNSVLYHKHPNKVVKTIVTYDSFFYPLDVISNWNRIYGKRGFTQYQLILPKENSRAGLAKILNRIADEGVGSFLGVLKLYRQQRGYLPFSIEGYSLALDFPITNGLFEFLDELDEIVLRHGGRLYLTKDVRMSKRMFMQSYPNVDRFIEQVKDVNNDNKFRSLQSDRVGITA